jgi:hypothetical protein
MSFEERFDRRGSSGPVLVPGDNLVNGLVVPLEAGEG